MRIRPNRPKPKKTEKLRLREIEGTTKRYSSSQYDVTASIENGFEALMIINADQSAERDYRAFMDIKDQIWGPESEAIEVYPSRDREVDPSNAFILWRWPERLGEPIGLPHKRVLPPEKASAPQRKFC